MSKIRQKLIKLFVKRRSSKAAQLNLAEAIRLRFEPFGGVDLELPPPVPVCEPPQFD